MNTQRFFLITIDTEGDNLWQNSEITTHNANFLPRFQMICERFGFKPTYLTNYEMAHDPAFQAFGHDVIQRQTAEIGTHLHAWNNPPLAQLTDNDAFYKPYLIEYSDNLMREKFLFLHHYLENTFGVPMRSHRAGRWAFDTRYAQILAELGYWVDCSVTPYINWNGTMGDPKGKGGTDFRRFPDQAYFMDLEQIDQEGKSGLLEVPMTIRNKHPKWVNNMKVLIDRLRRKTPRPPSTRWLRSGRGNLQKMKQTASMVLNEPKADYIEYMLHSSEFMPGGSPTFDTDERIELLYQDLESFFRWLVPQCQGATLSEYYQFKRQNV